MNAVVFHGQAAQAGEQAHAPMPLAKAVIASTVGVSLPPVAGSPAGRSELGRFTVRGGLLPDGPSAKQEPPANGIEARGTFAHRRGGGTAELLPPAAA